MPKYKCKSISLKQLVFNKGIPISSLCDRCISSDCENDVRKTKISELGINKERRLIRKNEEMLYVIDCEGFIPEKFTEK